MDGLVGRLLGWLATVQCVGAWEGIGGLWDHGVSEPIGGRVKLWMR